MLDKMMQLKHLPSKMNKKPSQDDVLELPEVDILQPKERNIAHEEQYGSNIIEENRARSEKLN